jgi:hypothetical protein
MVLVYEQFCLTTANVCRLLFPAGLMITRENVDRVRYLAEVYEPRH